MGKSSRKNKSETEYLRGIIREQTREIRHLTKRVKELEKSAHIYEEVLLGDREAAFEETVKPRVCQSCGKGELKEFDILGRVFEECSICEHRKKIS